MPAVNRFVRTTAWRMLALTVEPVPTFVLAKDLDHPRVKMFLGLLLRLVPGIIELRSDPLDQYCHREHVFDEGGHNVVMSF